MHDGRGAGGVAARSPAIPPGLVRLPMRSPVRSGVLRPDGLPWRVPEVRSPRTCSHPRHFFVLRGARSLALLRRSAIGLAALADSGSMAAVMVEQMLHDLGARASPPEKRSWDRSIPVLAHVLVDAGLGNVEVLLRDRVPLA